MTYYYTMENIALFQNLILPKLCLGNSKLWYQKLVRVYREQLNLCILRTSCVSRGQQKFLYKVLGFLHIYIHTGFYKESIFEQDDVSLCARCFIRGSYKVRVNPSDFRKVEISNEVKTDWTDKETLHLLEAVMHYRDDWKRLQSMLVEEVLEIVLLIFLSFLLGNNLLDLQILPRLMTRFISEMARVAPSFYCELLQPPQPKERVAHFLKLPFGEQFVGPPDSAEVDDKIHQSNGQRSTKFLLRSTTASPTKRMHLTTFADANNPIMAQASFLSPLVGLDVVQAAAHAAVWALYEHYNDTSNKERLGSLSSGGARQQDACVTSNCNTTTNASVEACEEARLQLNKEDDNLEQAISGIGQVQMENQEMIVHFEEFDLQMEKKSSS